LNQGPFAPPALPGLITTTGLSATSHGPACSSPSSGWNSRDSTVGASRVACRFLFHACRRHYPGGTGRVLSLISSDRRRPSLLFRQIGSHVTRFEACSAFTRVTACVFAESPSDPSLEVLQSNSLPPWTAPSATGWSNQSPGGVRTHWNQQAFSRHTE